MKLVLYDAGWRLYLPLLLDALATKWEIATGENDLNWLLGEIAAADALLAPKLPLEARPVARQLKALLFPGAGAMHSDPVELPAGCVLANVFEHEIPIAEYVMMMIFLHVTQAMQYMGSFRDGSWEGNGRVGGETHDETYGKTLGLVGYGHIGQTVAARARAFGMKVCAVCADPSVVAPEAAALAGFLGGPADLDRVLEAADFLVIACPLTPATEGMIGERELGRMPARAMLINVARAEIIREAPLYEALRTRRIAAAALDAWYRYPAHLSERMHGSRLPFHELDNVMCTPHISGWTHALLERRMRKIAANLDHLARGEELERVVLRGTWRQEPQPPFA